MLNSHSFWRNWALSLALVGASFATVAQAQNAQNEADVAANQNVVEVNQDAANVPCPPFWMVQLNPSVENSLSYVHESGKLAVSVTYVADQTGAEVGSESFSRVAAEQMNCTLPVKSNILKNAWSFNCEDGIEALVYGDPGNLVLLSISGRNEDTESYFESFISFLSYQAKAR